MNVDEGNERDSTRVRNVRMCSVHFTSPWQRASAAADRLLDRPAIRLELARDLVDVTGST